MNLLSKFAQVEIDPSKTLLMGENAETCIKIEKDYLDAFQFHGYHLEFFEINKEHNRYLDINSLMIGVVDSVKSLSKEFVDDIVLHFTSKYKIHMDLNDFYTKVLPEYRDNRYRSMTYDEDKLNHREIIEKNKVNMKDILSIIQDKLGGMSLEEKSENEVKDKFYKEFAKPWNKNWKNNKVEPVVELIKNRIVFERGIRLEKQYKAGIHRISSYDEKDLGILLQGLSHFETGVSTVLGCFNLRTWCDYDDEFILSDIEYDTLEKLQSIRFYKNRKMVLKFKSESIAKDFFKEWCRNGEHFGEEN